MSVPSAVHKYFIPEEKECYKVLVQ